MESILERLKWNTTRDSTSKNYYRIWKIFNGFIMKLDKKPSSWEQRLSLFGAYLVESGKQSSTIRSYFSAIRKILDNDGYELKENVLALHSLTKACRLINDKVTIRRPIHRRLMETMLFEVERIFKDQFYLQILYQTLFILAYYGLFRIGELTESPHIVKAKDVSIGTNKNKMQLILYSSKTHAQESKPQVVKISEVKITGRNTFFCPFNLFRKYKKIRGPYKNDNEQLFMFRDRQPVKPSHARNILEQILKRLDLDVNKFTFHCFRSGRATDMIRLGYSIEEIKICGRWKSNAVYKYIK